MGGRGSSSGFENFRDIKVVGENFSKKFDGKLSSGSNDKKRKYDFVYANQKFVLRIMAAGSGLRAKPYFRISINGKGSLTIDGIISDVREKTHIDLTEKYLKDAEHMLLSFARRYRK